MQTVNTGFSAARKRAALAALAAAFLLVPLRAEDPDDIVFAVPDAGLITLGVFDKAGRLVRTLHRLAPEKAFRVEVNGYATKWDGNDDSGRHLPAGHYHLRGYVVGKIRVAGEDFHFNDWSAGEGSPMLSRILDFSLLENGDVVVLAREGSGKLLAGRFSPDSGFLWAKAPDSSAGSAKPGAFEPMLATNDASAIVLSAGGWDVLSLESGEAGPARPFEGRLPPAALAATPGSAFAATPDGLLAFALPGWTSRNLQPPPPAFKALDADAARLIGVADDGVRLQKSGSGLEKIPLAADITSVSLGAGDTFWIVGSEPGCAERIVAQASPAGEILRALRPESGAPQPDKIRASRTAEKFAVLESRPGLQRLRVMERAPDGGWTIAWQRAIEDSSRFGFVNDRAIADAGEKIPEGELAFRLEENPLTGKREMLPLRAVFDKTGTRLVTPDGLPVVEVSQQADVSRIAVCRGEAPDTMRLLQGNGSIVEEFSISGLGRILPIDAGGVDLP